MENELKRLTELIEELQDDSSMEMKLHCLTNYEDCKDILKWVYDPLIKFNIKGDRVLEYIEDTCDKITPYKTYDDIFELLRDLSNRKITGNEALTSCAGFMVKHERYIDTIIKILNKDLKCGISYKSINRVFPKLIPEFQVPLAYKYDEKYCDFENEEWIASRKLDGIRCLAFIYSNGDIKFYSRGGREFYTLDVLKEKLKSIFNNPNKEDFILDGEMCIVDKNGKEDFKGIMSEIRKKNHTIKNPKFFIFDTYSMEEFNSSPCTRQNYDTRMIQLRYEVDSLPFKLLEALRYVEVLDQYLVKSKEGLDKLVLEQVKENWEGLMLRGNCPTHFKRDRSLLKVKKFKDAEYTVIGIGESKKIIDGIDTTCCGSLVIKHKNGIVHVGSGLSDEQRVQWYKVPEKILGKKITVQFFEESKDKTGKASLRFPTLKHVWSSVRE